MPELEDRIRATRPTEVRLPDMGVVRRRARRTQRRRTAAVVGIVVVAFVGLGLGARTLVGAPSVRIDEPVGGGAPASSPAPTASSPSTSPTTSSSTSPPGGAATPTPGATVTDPQVTGWYLDADRDAAERAGAWIAAWFLPADAQLGDPLVRWWRPVEVPSTPADAMRRAVEALGTDPPPGMHSAFAAGLAVRGVTVEGTEVVLDLDAASPGLAGHGSYGLVLGTDQLVEVAAHYFPDARTLCVAYDGTPTGAEAGGPVFLHDADGCPLDLP